VSSYPERDKRGKGTARRNGQKRSYSRILLTHANAFAVCASIPDEAAAQRGPFVTGISDDSFFEFCQGNDLARIERTANQEIIVLPPVGADGQSG